MLHVVEDAVLDSVKLVPFLFLTYLLMEYLEHKAGAKVLRAIERAGGSGRGLNLGPVAGALLGALPQCGFSAASSNLYAGRVISLGALMSIYLSTSDEMLPILLSERAPVGMIAKMLLIKVAVGMAAGLAIDFVLKLKGKEQHGRIHDICEQEHCGCEKGILRSAFVHTIQIFFFILLVTFALNLVLFFMGEDVLENLILNHPVLGPVLAALVGLMPNCAGSVVITRLYLEGAMGLGAAAAGLLSGSGLGVLVLFRVNHDRKENLKILGLLYCIGAGVGIMIGLIWS